MQTQDFHLRPGDESIELHKLIKIAGLAETGGQAKDLIRMEQVGLNGTPELQLRKQVRAGDTVRVYDHEIRILPPK